MSKIKEGSGKTGIDKITLAATILIVAISILSVISVFFLNDIQSKIKSNEKLSDDYYSILAVIEGDISIIIDHEMKICQNRHSILVPFRHIVFYFLV